MSWGWWELKISEKHQEKLFNRFESQTQFAQQDEVYREQFSS